MKTIVLDIGDESADWIKSFNTRIKKAKVYVKNPAEAPPGVKLQEGKRGGQYYMSDDIERSKPTASKTQNIKTINIDSPEFLKIMPMMDDEDIKKATPISSVYIEKLIKDRKIDLSGATLNLLPLNMLDAFAFVSSRDPTNIYLPAADDFEINKWNNETKEALLAASYSEDELDFGIEDKRATTIIHEVGHTKVHKFINLKDIKNQEDFQQIEFNKFIEYATYLHDHYGTDFNLVHEKLDEILAEDYRQLIGGSQAKIPNRYLFPVDTINSANYKYKEGRLNILRKMGVF